MSAIPSSVLRECNAVLCRLANVPGSRRALLVILLRRSSNAIS